MNETYKDRYCQLDKIRQELKDSLTRFEYIKGFLNQEKESINVSIVGETSNAAFKIKSGIYSALFDLESAVEFTFNRLDEFLSEMIAKQKAKIDEIRQVLNELEDKEGVK